MKQLSRSSWHIFPECKEKYTKMIQEYIQKLEEDNLHQIRLNLNGENINPYQVGEILQELGYDYEYEDDNGWEQDTCYLATKEGFKPITIEHSGIIFSLELYCKWHTGGYRHEVEEYEKSKRGKE